MDTFADKTSLFSKREAAAIFLGRQETTNPAGEAGSAFRLRFVDDCQNNRMTYEERRGAAPHLTQRVGLARFALRFGVSDQVP